MEDKLGEFLKASNDLANLVMAYTIQYAFSVLGAILLLIIGWLVAGILQRSIKSSLQKFDNIDKTLAGFFGNIIRYLVLIIVLVMVLGQFGVQTASIVAALGAAGLAIGLALQGTLQNIAAGIMLLVLRPFRVGEYISTGSIDGTVVEIGLFATELKTFDGLYRLAPNSTLWNVSITNYSRLSTRMHELAIGIAYEDDIDTAMNIMMDLASKNENVLSDPEPYAFTKELGDSAVLVAMRYWAPSSVWWKTTHQMTKDAKNAFDAAGISIPFPQMTLSTLEGEANLMVENGSEDKNS
ncbi:mechanosensitive ion channel family protein [Martelella mediterranea]|uniref:Small-conductance mechanosensitive channel n=1 Tax=Martelella mediterranea TaxID=293089 RepID=A0A4R3NFH5_9HYPH|nr:mechanosensitive ion channel domain-containing protein [Martelella mediterranea]TCT31456.1 small conductance mechanosensitive channel [Martelella mediterranea]